MGNEKTLESAYFNSNENIILSTMSNAEKKYYLENLQAYLLTYRKTLNLPGKARFGTEIEFENLDLSILEDHMSTTKILKDWTLEEDEDVTHIINHLDPKKGTYKNGGEMISPIMTDRPKYWRQLKEVCQFLTDNNALITELAAGHIHLDTMILGDDVKAWTRLFKIWATFESVIGQFSNGEYRRGRSNCIKRAKDVGQAIFASEKELFNVNSMEEIEFSKILHGKSGAVSFYRSNPTSLNTRAEGNTIEIRRPNGTLNEIVWQNNINFFSKLSLSTKRDDFPDDLLEKHYQSAKNRSSIIETDCIDIQRASVLSDIVFDNNLDKAYFMKQYVNTFTVPTTMNEQGKVKEFTKKIVKVT